jgi:CO/xanthine dehydrogenase FAD-binding subunit
MARQVRGEGMIPFDFEYYRPDSVTEAVTLYGQLDSEGSAPVWYGGGSELISMARVGNMGFGAVIDVKAIPECRTLDYNGEYLNLGAALTLDEMSSAQIFPLLGKTAGRIADHTMQCRITFGGNLASTIIYRETVLPLMLSDAEITAAGKQGLKKYSIHNSFKERLELPKGELLVSAAVAKEFIKAPYFHIKKTKNEKIDYPLITTDALIINGFIRMAFSGLAAFPFRDAAVEEILNDQRFDYETRAEYIAQSVDGVLLDDMNGSAGYRRFVLKNTVINILESIKDAEVPCLR